MKIKLLTCIEELPFCRTEGEVDSFPPRWQRKMWLPLLNTDNFNISHTEIVILKTLWLLIFFITVSKTQLQQFNKYLLCHIIKQNCSPSWIALWDKGNILKCEHVNPEAMLPLVDL